MRQTLINQLDQLDNLPKDLYIPESDEVFDESMSVSTSATSLDVKDQMPFGAVARNMIQAGEHTCLKLECLQDMLLHENKLLEEVLASFTNDVSVSVPMNSHKCRVLPLKPFSGIAGKAPKGSSRFSPASSCGNAT